MKRREMVRELQSSFRVMSVPTFPRNEESLDSSPVRLDLAERWMDRILDVCREGVRDGQAPFAAAVVRHDGEIIATAHNTVRRSGQPSRHGEVNAIDSACRILDQPQLEGLVLVSTGEPCPLCAAMAAEVKIADIVFGAPRDVIEQAGYQTLGVDCKDLFHSIGQKVRIVRNVRYDQCRQLLLQNPQTE